MNICKAKITDSAEIARLHRGTIRHINSKDYSQEIIKEWSSDTCAKNFRESQNSCIRYIAKINNKIVGYSDMSLNGEFWGLYVHKDYLGKRIGTTLLDKMELEAQKIGAKKFVFLATKTAQKFYEKRGYKTLKKVKYELNADKKIFINVYKMQKNFLYS